MDDGSSPRTRAVGSVSPTTARTRSWKGSRTRYAKHQLPRMSSRKCSSGESQTALPSSSAIPSPLLPQLLSRSEYPAGKSKSSRRNGGFTSDPLGEVRLTYPPMSSATASSSRRWRSEMPSVRSSTWPSSMNPRSSLPSIPAARLRHHERATTGRRAERSSVSRLRKRSRMSAGASGEGNGRTRGVAAVCIGTSLFVMTDQNQKLTRTTGRTDRGNVQMGASVLCRPPSGVRRRAIESESIRQRNTGAQTLMVDGPRSAHS